MKLIKSSIHAATMRNLAKSFNQEKKIRKATN